MAGNIMVVTIILLLFMGIRRVIDGKISARLQYALWLLIGVRLLLVWFPLPGSSFSVMNLIPTMQELDQEGQQNITGEQGREAEIDFGQTFSDLQENKVSTQESGSSQAENDSDPGEGSQQNERLSSNGGLSQKEGKQGQLYAQADQGLQYGKKFSENGIGVMVLALSRVAILIYGIGAAIVLLWIVGKNLWFWRGIRKSRIPYEGILPDVLLPGRLYLLEQLKSPFLFGRNIYVSPEMVCDESRLHHILVHETSHWKQGDLLWSLVRNLCLVMYWYHPLVWVGAHLSMIDEELACDERVIRILGDENRLEYGETLLGFIREQSGMLDCVSISTQMSGSKRETKKRLERIAIIKKRTVGRILFLSVSMLILCLITLPGKKTQTANDPDVWWERVEQEGYPCIVLDEQGNLVGTRRGELLTKVCLDYTTSHLQQGIQNYQIHADAFSECRNLKTLILPYQDPQKYIGVIDYIDEDAFRNCPKELTVYCQKESYAWERLQELGMRVKEYQETQEGPPRWLTLGEDEDALKKIQKKADPENDDTLQLDLLTEQELLQFYGEPFFMMTESGQLVHAICDSLGTWTGRKLCFPNEAKMLMATFPQHLMMDLSVTIPKNIVEVGDDSFMACQIKEVRFEDGSRLQKIGDRAFLDGVTGKIQLPEGVLEIGQSAFEMCSGLKEVTIPKSVRSLGSRCFIGCDSLERVVILNPDITLEEEIFDQELINEDLEAVPNEQLRIVCHRESNAEKYAREHHLQIEYLPSGE